MQASGSRRCAGALLATLVATLLLPLAALWAAPRAAAPPRTCHCPVRMACCEAGLCHAGEAPDPSGGPSWSGCRDEAPLQAGPAAPSSALDAALLPARPRRSREAGALALPLPVDLGDERSPSPATPPPRA